MTPIEVRRIVSAELGIGEELLWTDQPIPKGAMSQALPIFLFGCIWAAFCIPSFIANIASQSVTPDLSSILFMVPFVLIGLACLLSPVFTFYRARETIYAITNRRIIIIKVGFARTVQRFDPGAINTLERTERQDGLGDLLFRRTYTTDSEGHKNVQVEQFLAIPNAQHVEELLKDLLKSYSLPDVSPLGKIPGLLIESRLAIRERIERQFIILEEGNTLRIRRSKKGDWRLRKSAVGSGFGCSAFLLPFALLSGGMGSGLFGQGTSPSGLNTYMSVAGILFMLTSVSLAAWSIVTLLFGWFGSEEWLITEDRFTVCAQMLGLRWTRNWSGCSLRIGRKENQEGSWSILSISDPNYRFGDRLVVLQTDNFEDVQELSDLISHYSGWKTQIQYS